MYEPRLPAPLASRLRALIAVVLGRLLRDARTALEGSERSQVGRRLASSQVPPSTPHPTPSQTEAPSPHPPHRTTSLGAWVARG